MGRKKKERESSEKLFLKALNMPVPFHIVEDFEMWDAEESKERRVIEIREKEARIPEALSEFENIVFDDYCCKVERINGKIQRFVSNNYDLKDKDFFLYRLVNYFSWRLKKRFIPNNNAICKYDYFLYLCRTKK
ncbi:MAG: hypothetical protein LBI60_06040 [Bacteroidales bacterium]|jgi:hypothetical protein|nr:hypothetical protein [Bacteroidales bacterium]